jgi:hypothetical protein
MAKAVVISDTIKSIYKKIGHYVFVAINFSKGVTYLCQ